MILYSLERADDFTREVAADLATHLRMLQSIVATHRRRLPVGGKAVAAAELSDFLAGAIDDLAASLGEDDEG
jgi:hypothetical protein